MTKYKIYAGLGGGFGGAQYISTEECETESEALDIAYQAACEDYESFAGTRGLRTFEEIAEDEGLDLNDPDDYDYVNDVYQDELEGWITYHVEKEE